MRDLELLGLSEGATAEEIKRAYFRAIRKYTPERDPEMFQQVRAAYDRLCSGTSPSATEDLPFTLEDDPTAKNAYDTLSGEQSLAESLDWLKALVEVYPEENWFRLQYARALLEAEKSGLAVKEMEKLAVALPDSAPVQRLLAMALTTRGWWKKAIPVYQCAVQLGVRDDAFLLQLVATMVRSLPDETLVETMITCLTPPLPTDTPMRQKQSGAVYFAVFDGLEEEVDLYKRFVPLLMDFVRQMKIYGLPPAPRIFIHSVPRASIFDTEAYRLSVQLMRLIEEVSPESDRESVKEELTGYQFARYFFTADTTEEWRMLLRHAMDEDKGIQRKLSLMDARILLYLTREKQLNDLPALKEDYPELWTAIAPHVVGLEDAERSKEIVQDLVQQAIHSGYENWEFAERFPELLQQANFHNSEVEGSYTREKKKIGRNDPCPCGSGRKFKQCHMGKGVYD